MFKLILLWIWLAALGGGLHYVSKNTMLFSRNQRFDLKRFKRDAWFGQFKDSVPEDSPAIRDFRVNVSDSELSDLKNRLSAARFVDHIEDTQFTYGFNSQYLKQVVEYWQTKYDWRKEEAKLNAYEQFKTQIEGIDVHFVRVKPSKQAKTVLPLLVVHGWPGSVLEYYKSFPLLTEPDQNGLGFEVIAPSIPGFGFSEAPHQKGFNITASARVFVKLMTRLGFEKFLVHGGDVGYGISRTIALVYPERTIGAHLIGNVNGKPASLTHLFEMLFASTFPRLYFGPKEASLQYSKSFPFTEKLSYLLAESGYFHIQATKPDTIGSALVDSPVGLAAWILEKFSTWTNKDNRAKEDGGLSELNYSLDEMLTNVMIYWTSGNIASSQRMYKENVESLLDLLSARVEVPVGSVDMPHELTRTPRKLLQQYYTNLLQYTEMPRGGHFAAFEEPQLIVDDIRSFVRKVFEFQAQQLKEQEELLKLLKRSKRSEM